MPTMWMTSELVLNDRNGARFVFPQRYGTALPDSTAFSLTLALGELHPIRTLRRNESGAVQATAPDLLRAAIVRPLAPDLAARFPGRQAATVEGRKGQPEISCGPSMAQVSFR